jgi:hypothetical protein
MIAHALRAGTMKPEYSESKNRTPVEIVHELAAIAAIAILLGVILPGGVAYKARVFDRKSLLSRVKSVRPEAAALLSKGENSREQAREALAALDSQIKSGGVNSASNLSLLRQAYVQEIAKPLPISVQPFNSSLIVYFWAMMYFGLGSAIFVIGPSDGYARREGINRSVCLLALGIFAFSVGPLLIRTLAFAGPASGRTVYAWSNPDLSLASFCVQIFNFAVFSFCLAIIWSHWSSFAESHHAFVKEESGDTSGLSISLVHDLSRMLYRWQITFASVSSGFVVYTAIFWNQIVRNQDWRFGCEAIVAHVFWLVTIAITATPVVTTWRAWNQQKVNAIIALLNEEKAPSADLEARIAAIRNIQPITGWNLTASVAAVATSLVGPLLQTLIK